jgi:hypothetical protein
MRTLEEPPAPGDDWLVKLSAGMPGGIGNTGHECGAVTSSLVHLGVRHGLRETDDGLPIVFDCSHVLCQRFLDRRKTLQCEEIRGDDRFPRHCIPPIVAAPGLFSDVLTQDARDAIPADARRAYASLYGHMTENCFHCAHAVFLRLHNATARRAELMDATSAFIGGTAFMGLTCSAFTAGVMALGLSRAEIEDSVARVVRMLALMTLGRDALKADVNKFNPSLMRGYRLSRWFVHEFGSTQCSAITQCDFATSSGVEAYVRSGQVTDCETIADKVAAKVERMLSAETRVA